MLKICSNLKLVYLIVLLLELKCTSTVFNNIGIHLTTYFKPIIGKAKYYIAEQTPSSLINL